MAISVAGITCDGAAPGGGGGSEMPTSAAHSIGASVAARPNLAGPTDGIKCAPPLGAGGAASIGSGRCTHPFEGAIVGGGSACIGRRTSPTSSPTP